MLLFFNHKSPPCEKEIQFCGNGTSCPCTVASWQSRCKFLMIPTLVLISCWIALILRTREALQLTSFGSHLQISLCKVRRLLRCFWIHLLKCIFNGAQRSHTRNCLTKLVLAFFTWRLMWTICMNAIRRHGTSRGLQRALSQCNLLLLSLVNSNHFSHLRFISSHWIACFHWLECTHSITARGLGQVALDALSTKFSLHLTLFLLMRLLSFKIRFNAAVTQALSSSPQFLTCAWRMALLLLHLPNWRLTFLQGSAVWRTEDLTLAHKVVNLASFLLNFPALL
jgi:hypothetical protein